MRRVSSIALESQNGHQHQRIGQDFRHLLEGTSRIRLQIFWEFCNNVHPRLARSTKYVYESSNTTFKNIAF